jgi:hypothetical protein
MKKSLRVLSALAAVLLVLLAVDVLAVPLLGDPKGLPDFLRPHRGGRPVTPPRGRPTRGAAAGARGGTAPGPGTTNLMDGAAARGLP